MGCGPSKAQLKREKKEQEQIERDVKIKQDQMEGLKEELEGNDWGILGKAKRKRLDLDQDNDWGLMDAQIHSEEHLLCHETTLINNTKRAKDFLELCADSYKALEKLPKMKRFNRLDNVQKECDRVTSEVKQMEQSVEVKMKEYAAYWVKQVCVPSDGRKCLVELLVRSWPEEYSPDQFAHLYDEHEEHVKKCDDGHSKKWDEFVEERNSCVADLYKRINTKCDELQERYEAWKQNPNHDEITSSDCIHHKTPFAITDEKRDRITFPETDTKGNRELFLEWSELLRTEFSKLSNHVEELSKSVYAKHYGNEEMQNSLSSTMHKPKLSPAVNVGALVDERLTLQRSYWVELTSEEYRLDDGKFKSEEERREYMIRFDKVKVGLHDGRRRYKRGFTDYSAQKVAVEAVCRRSTDVGWLGLNFLVFPGGSCLDGLDLRSDGSSALTKSNSKTSLAKAKPKGKPKKKS